MPREAKLPIGTVILISKRLRFAVSLITLGVLMGLLRERLGSSIWEFIAYGTAMGLGFYVAMTLPELVRRGRIVQTGDSPPVLVLPARAIVED